MHEIGCKQAVSRSANEFTLNAFVVLSIIVINRLISGNLVYLWSKTIHKRRISSTYSYCITIIFF